MSELEHVRELLPWLVNGKLSSNEEGMLYKAMKRYPALQKDYEVQKELARMIRQDPSVMDIAVITTQDQRLNVLMDRIHSDQDNRRPFFAPYQKLFTKARSRLNELIVPKRNGWVFTAIVIVIVVQMAILSTVMDDSGLAMPPGYTTASEDQAERSSRPSIIIHFVAGAPKQDIDQLIHDIKGEVGRHPDGTTYYQIFLEDTMDVASLISELGNNKILIDFVGRGN